MPQKNNNIKIIYIISFLRNAFFWNAVWVFYYLLFTDYAGIGLIEALMFLSFVIFEIPSGAVSDLVGKKKTILLASFFGVIGAAMMASAPSFSYMLMAVPFISISGAFFSGTIEALVYDSLKEKKKEKSYGKIISDITSISLISTAIATVIGGYLFTIAPSLPLWCSAFISLLGLIAAFSLKEPSIDTEKFSWKNFVNQNKQGLKQLSKTPEIKRQTMLLLSIGLFSVVAREILNDVLAVEFNFSPKQLSIFLGTLALFAAMASQLTSKLSKRFSLNSLFFSLGIVIVVTLVVSPFLGLILGGISIAIRIMVQSIFGNLTSLAINKNTESRYRATTLSTFSLMTNIPYIMVVYFTGYIMNIISAKIFAAGMGTLMFLFLFLQFLLNTSVAKTRNK